MNIGRSTRAFASLSLLIAVIWLMTLAFETPSRSITPIMPPTASVESVDYITTAVANWNVPLDARTPGGIQAHGTVGRLYISRLGR